jgi:hypothetical protein
MQRQAFTYLPHQGDHCRDERSPESAATVAQPGRALLPPPAVQRQTPALTLTLALTLTQTLTPARMLAHCVSSCTTVSRTTRDPPPPPPLPPPGAQGIYMGHVTGCLGQATVHHIGDGSELQFPL